MAETTPTIRAITTTNSGKLDAVIQKTQNIETRLSDIEAELAGFRAETAQKLSDLQMAILNHHNSTG